MSTTLPEIHKAPETDTEAEAELEDTGDEEWHIESAWEKTEAVCGATLPSDGALPCAEVPDEITCRKCLSIEKSLLYNYVTSPLMCLKVKLVG